jgi:cysteinyl-tRNA synthetase
LLKRIFREYIFDVLGLMNEATENNEVAAEVINLLISMRDEAKAKKDFATSDKIRDELSKIKIVIKDSKDGTTWSMG